MENEEKIWKPIIGFEGLYEVSNIGEIRSLNKTVKCRNRFNKNTSIRIIKGRILKQVDTGHGYLQVCLRKNNKNYSLYVHRLVAEVFIQNPKNMPFINHIDENKSNNKVSNLEWCTAQYNCNYGTRTERILKNRKSPDFNLSNNPKAKRVEMYSLDNIYQMTFNSIKEAFIYLNLKNAVQSNVSNVCNGKLKTAYKHIWKWPIPQQ